ncbi:MarR family winged helix-turn-helix transcriptional regulator [Kineococcus sp. SYSU DK003]|uniref:MarR family winged helix-turn-helix transcriptional regulator n=1 Tax=Kineococcus sp. SYSU DK003 TaxID=3383124 RepID=UPI003D7DB8D3
MATPHACATLVDAFPAVLRFKRALVATTAVYGTAPLAAVAELGHPRVSELAEHLRLDVSTVSRQVAHLRQRGLLEATPDPVDGRSQQLSLTAAGLDELRRSRRALVEDITGRLADWDDADVETLAELLGRLGADPPTGTGAPAGAPAPSAARPLEQNA